jgi:hypothetical protein
MTGLRRKMRKRMVRNNGIHEQFYGGLYEAESEPFRAEDDGD